MKQLSIYEFSDYREYISSHIKLLPARGKGELSKISKILNIQSSMLSQIMRSRRDFTLEQACDLATYLGLNTGEAEYFLLLVQYSRARSENLKRQLRSQLGKMRNSAVALVERPSEVFALGESDKQRFFSTWHFIAVWLLSFLPEKNTEGEFSKRLKLPAELISEAVDFLIAAKLCKREHGQVLAGPVRTHLEGSEPLRRQHHLNWRIKGMDKLLLSPSTTDFNLSFPMCLSSNDSTVIKEMLRDFVRKIDPVIAPSRPEKVFCLNIDWFEI